MKRKVFKVLSTMLLMLSIVFLSACGPTPSVTPKPNTTPPPPEVNNRDEDGNMLALSDLFYQYKVISSGDVSVVDPASSNTEKSFNDLLERQIEVVATDILYRLSIVYGPGTKSDDINLKSDGENNYSYNGSDAAINTRYLINYPYYILNNIVKYLNKDFEDIEDDVVFNDYFNILDSGYYARVFLEGRWDTDKLLATVFRNTHAIQGGEVWDETLSTPQFIAFDGGFDNQQYSWNWDYSSAGISNAVALGSDVDELLEEYVSYYKKYLKSAIAQILAGKTTIDVGFNTIENSYREFIPEINHLGFTEQNRQDILDFVLNNVIDGDLYGLGFTKNNLSVDRDVARELGDFLGGEFDGQKYTEIDLTRANYKTFDDIEYLHYYRAYDVLVPAMLDRTFSLQFGGKEIDRYVYENDVVVGINAIDEYESITLINNETFASLYPKMARRKADNLSVEALPPSDDPTGAPEVQMISGKIESIILQPKNNAAVRSLFVFLGTEENQTVSLKMKVKYVANGVTYLNDYVSLSGGASSNQTVTFTGKFDPKYKNNEGQSANVRYNYMLDIYPEIISDYPAAQSAYPHFSEATNVNPNYDLWNNNPFKLSGYDAGINYLEISFEYVGTDVPVLDVGFSIM